MGAIANLQLAGGSTSQRCTGPWWFFFTRMLESKTRTLTHPAVPLRNYSTHASVASKASRPWRTWSSACSCVVYRLPRARPQRALEPGDRSGLPLGDPRGPTITYNPGQGWLPDTTSGTAHPSYTAPSSAGAQAWTSRVPTTTPPGYRTGSAHNYHPRKKETVDNALRRR